MGVGWGWGLPNAPNSEYDGHAPQLSLHRLPSKLHDCRFMTARVFNPDRRTPFTRQDDLAAEGHLPHVCARQTFRHISCRFTSKPQQLSPCLPGKHTSRSLIVEFTRSAGGARVPSRRLLLVSSVMNKSLDRILQSWCLVVVQYLQCLLGVRGVGGGEREGFVQPSSWRVHGARCQLAFL